MFKLVVLSCVMSVALGAPSLGALGWGLGWGGLAGHLGGPLGAPLVAPYAAAHLAAPLAVAPAVAAAPAIAAYNYRGPLSLAPGQPANILAQDGRPLDTLSVNLDRAAHLTARALDPAGAHAHLIGKRSAPLLGAAWSHTARIDLPAARLVAPAALGIHAAPFGIAGAVAPYGLHGAVAPWGVGHLGLGGHLGRVW